MNDHWVSSLIVESTQHYLQVRDKARGRSRPLRILQTVWKLIYIYHSKFTVGKNLLAVYLPVIPTIFINWYYKLLLQTILDFVNNVFKLHFILVKAVSQCTVDRTDAVTIILILSSVFVLLHSSLNLINLNGVHLVSLDLNKVSWECPT